MPVIPRDASSGIPESIMSRHNAYSIVSGASDGSVHVCGELIGLLRTLREFGSLNANGATSLLTSKP